MTETRITLPDQALTSLEGFSPSCVRHALDGRQFTAEILIPDYAKNVTRHYAVDSAALPAGEEFRNFGLLITFDQPANLFVYDDEKRLDPHIREWVAKFGAVIFRNAFLSDKKRSEGQRNIFASLVFHLDRGHHFDNRFSLFMRDPFDDVQRFPRKSSTLVISNNVARLQAEKEGEKVHDSKPRYDIFKNQNVKPLIGSLMLEQPWTAPEGTGEICIIDNRTVYHASYYEGDKGYPIGVRYLY